MYAHAAHKEQTTSMQITTHFQVITPAYGRDYRSAVDATADFLAGKDFLLQSATYGFDLPISIADFASGVRVNIRFANKTKVTVMVVK